MDTALPTVPENKFPHMERDTSVAHVTGFEVYRSPEFKAFCKRFGIAWGLPTKHMVITIEEDCMRVDQEYLAGEHGGSPPGVIDTTSAHNVQWRTAIPNSNPYPGRLDDPTQADVPHVKE